MTMEKPVESMYLLLKMVDFPACHLLNIASEHSSMNCQNGGSGLHHNSFMPDQHTIFPPWVTTSSKHPCKSMGFMFFVFGGVTNPANLYLRGGKEWEGRLTHIAIHQQKRHHFFYKRCIFFWETWSNMVFPTKGRLIFTVKFQKIDPAKLSGTRSLSRNMTFKTFSFSFKVDWLSEI